MNALRAEWTKLRTEGGTGWLLLLAVILTIGVGAGISAAVSADPCTGRQCQDMTRLSLNGLMVGQAVVAIVGVLAIGNEYGTGLIRTSLTAMPNRLSMLAAKAAVLTLVTAVVGLLVTAGSLIAGRIIMPGNGFNAKNGYTLLTLGDAPLQRAALGSVLYLVLIGMLALGCATIVRESASAAGIVLGLLYIFPIISHVVTDPEWQKRIQQISPMSAGQAVMATVGIDNLPIEPWKGLGVLALWAAVAMLGGALVIRLRDA